jgi:hypothetical protein
LNGDKDIYSEVIVDSTHNSGITLGVIYKMRNKIIMITAMLAVMVAMTGIAAATPYNAALWDAAGLGVAPTPLSLVPGNSLTLSYRADTIAIQSPAEVVPYFSLVTVISGVGALPSDVTITTPLNLTLDTDPKLDTGVITVTLSPSAPVGARYRLDIGAGGGTFVELGSASRPLDSIPEFPTVALPIAAVIGLVFFFQNKKKKE